NHCRIRGILFYITSCTLPALPALPFRITAILADTAKMPLLSMRSLHPVTPRSPSFEKALPWVSETSRGSSRGKGVSIDEGE
ncbi:MAG: hypothetical protein QHG99_08055, partial [Methanomicrobiales archaeon]|nr:hypothetical protein [Methanomicrobiales archaeon]